MEVYIMNEKRRKAEELIYKVLDALDKDEYNSSYYKSIFAKMSDVEFLNFCKRNLPFRFHTKPFVVEPKMYDIEEALKILGEVYETGKYKQIKTKVDRELSAKYYERYIKLVEDGDLLYKLGLLMLDIQNFSKAITYLEKATSSWNYRIMVYLNRHMLIHSL